MLLLLTLFLSVLHAQECPYITGNYHCEVGAGPTVAPSPLSIYEFMERGGGLRYFRMTGPFDGETAYKPDGRAYPFVLPSGEGEMRTSCSRGRIITDYIFAPEKRGRDLVRGLELRVETYRSGGRIVRRFQQIYPPGDSALVLYCSTPVKKR